MTTNALSLAKPCPFCDRMALTFERTDTVGGRIGYSVGCFCGASGPTVSDYEETSESHARKKFDAVTQWNKALRKP